MYIEYIECGLVVTFGTFDRAQLRPLNVAFMYFNVQHIFRSGGLLSHSRRGGVAPVSHNKPMEFIHILFKIT